MPDDIFQGADKDECDLRLRYQAVLFLQAARKRIRLARRRMAETALTATEVKVLTLVLQETADILVSRTLMNG